MWYKATSTDITEVADAIRAKTGSSAELEFPDEFVTAIASIPTGGGQYQSKSQSFTPSTSAQSATITADSGFDALASVTVTVTAMTTMTLPTAVSSSGSGTAKLTVSRSTSDQYINIPIGWNSAAAYYKISAVPNGTAGTPTATKGAVSNHSIAVTPSVTNSTGYISGGTKTGTAVTVSASELVSGTKTFSANTTSADVTNYKYVTVNTPEINNQDKTVSPSTTAQTVTADTGYSGLGTVVVTAMTAMTLPTATSAAASGTSKATITATSVNQYINIPTGWNSSAAYYKINPVLLQSKTATPSGVEQRITADTGYTALDKVTVEAIPAGVATAPQFVTGSSATVNTAGGLFVLSQNVSVTPDIPTAGYISSGTAGTSLVTLQADIAINDASDLTVSGPTVTAPAGYYSSTVSTTVTTMALTSPTSTHTGTKVGSNIGRSTSTRYINIPVGYNESAAYYQISAVANGSVTAPASISGTAATLTAGTNTITLTKDISVTPTVTTAGYISSGTAGTSSVSLSANVNVRGASDLTVSGPTVTAPAGYYGASASTSVALMTLPTATSAASSGSSKATITATSVNQYINIPTGYNSAGAYYKINPVLLQTKTVTPSGVEQRINADTSYTALEQVTVQAIPAGSVTAPSVASGSSATVTTAGGVFGLSKTIDITPTVTTEGYVSTGTAGSTLVTLTANVDINDASDLSASGATVTAAAGYYPSAVSTAITSGVAQVPATISGASASLSSGTNTITLTKNMSLTPSVTAGYISSGTARTASVSLTASVNTRNSASLTVSGPTVTAPAGYYSASASTSVASMTLPTATSSASSGTSKATITASSVNQYINIPTGYNSAAGYYKINPVTLQSKTVTPSGVEQRITADTSYTALEQVTVSAIPAGVATAPALISASSATVNTAGGLFVLSASTSVTPDITTAGYVSSGTAGTSLITMQADIALRSSSDVAVSGTTVTIPAGYYAQAVTKTVSGGGGVGTLINTTSLGALSTASTQSTNTNKSLTVSNADQYDLIVVEVSVDSVTNNRHVATVSMILLTGTSNVSTKNTVTVASNKWNCKVNSSGVYSTRQGTTAYGIYANSGSLSSGTLTIPLYYRYNSTSSGTINGNYTARVYGVKLYDLIGG